MANRPIIMPRLWKRVGNNRMETFGGQGGIADYAGADNGFLANSFVFYVSDVIVPVLTDGVLAAGLCPDASKDVSTVNPPTAMFGDKHWPFSLTGGLFLINISNDANAVGQANSAPQLSDVSVGLSYGLTRPTSGTYSGYQFLNVQETSLTLFTVVSKPAVIDGVAQVAATYNGLVLVQVIPSKIQMLGS